MVITGVYLDKLINAFTRIEWFLEVSKSAFHLISYPASYKFQKKVGRDRFIFSWNNRDIAEEARKSRDHLSEFKPSLFHAAGFANGSKRDGCFRSVPQKRILF